MSLILYVCLCASAQTQQQSSVQTQAPASSTNNQSTPPKITTQVDVVNVVFTVMNDDGKFVKDLTQNQFRILDNNRPPKEITSFEAQTGLPLRVGLLVDASNSVRDRFKFEQQAAIEFVQQSLTPDTDKAMVLAFDEIYEVMQDFTNDIDKLSSGIRKISPGGSTALWDSVYYACREKLMKEGSANPVRRVIVLISDGNDTQSHVYRKEAIDMAQRAEVAIFTISTSLGTNNPDGDHNLRLLADATGGRSFFPVAIQDVETAFVTIQHELRSQYSISYKPQDFVPNGQYRTISIKTIHHDYRVRAKKGYYTRKAAAD
ncbi:MAG TPA: VWA domain-containing protein [Candidatus Angelobacter sp.]